MYSSRKLAALDCQRRLRRWNINRYVGAKSQALINGERERFARIGQARKSFLKPDLDSLVGEEVLEFLVASMG